ncbi:unnamed protein product [Phaeothamnion confervicola]
MRCWSPLLTPYSTVSKVYECEAGIGRTGLMLALLAKAFGIQNPVSFVLLHYCPHIVETVLQFSFWSTTNRCRL